MKILVLKIKSMPFREVEEVVDVLYDQNISMHVCKQRVKPPEAKALALASYLRVEDFMLELLLSSGTI